MLKKGSKTYIRISIVSWILLIAYITTVTSIFTILFLVGICDYTNLDYLNASFNSYERDKNLIVDTFNEKYYFVDEKKEYKDINVLYEKMNSGVYYNNKLYIATYNVFKSEIINKYFNLYIYECDLVKKESRIVHEVENAMCKGFVATAVDTSLYFQYYELNSNGSRIEGTFEFNVVNFQYKRIAQGNFNVFNLEKNDYIINERKNTLTISNSEITRVIDKEKLMEYDFGREMQKYKLNLNDWKVFNDNIIFCYGLQVGYTPRIDHDNYYIFIKYNFTTDTLTFCNSFVTNACIENLNIYYAIS